MTTELEATHEFLKDAHRVRKTWQRHAIAAEAEAAALREKVKLVQEANEWWEAQGAGRLKGTAGEMAYFMLKRYRAALETK